MDPMPGEPGIGLIARLLLVLVPGVVLQLFLSVGGALVAEAVVESVSDRYEQTRWEFAGNGASCGELTNTEAIRRTSFGEASVVIHTSTEYRGWWLYRNDSAQNPNSDSFYWHVEIHNDGALPVQLLTTSYFLVCSDASSDEEHSAGSAFWERGHMPVIRPGVRWRDKLSITGDCVAPRGAVHGSFLFEALGKHSAAASGAALRLEPR